MHASALLAFILSAMVMPAFSLPILETRMRSCSKYQHQPSIYSACMKAELGYMRREVATEATIIPPEVHHYTPSDVHTVWASHRQNEAATVHDAYRTQGGTHGSRPNSSRPQGQSGQRTSHPNNPRMTSRELTNMDVREPDVKGYRSAHRQGHFHRHHHLLHHSQLAEQEGPEPWDQVSPNPREAADSPAGRAHRNGRAAVYPRVRPLDIDKVPTELRTHLLGFNRSP
ncbi:hypothetical protein DAEQUDRAFT_731534 [Daedalea quercina L-15889]|uniref:Secreted protein n=1 Tax=Daedalea quercina L-15889 TaxID=1314783 RepID=A0A165M8T7_9APHY|nr:hypothetical protein DAEQUDRAFT_731534 [Daedalea quercina L-15889]